MIDEHPLRRQIVEEMHLRRWPAIGTPALVIQFLRIVDEAERDAELLVHRTLPDGGVLHSGASPRHLTGQLAPMLSFTWERHHEASTLSVFVDKALDTDTTESANQAAHAGLAWAAQMPGQVVRATEIHIVDDEAAALALLEEQPFELADLVSCHIGQGARMWSDFRIGPNNLGRIVIAANGLNGHDLSRLIQRLQELGNYRNLSLLGLPVAQDSWKKLDQIEAGLVALAEDVAKAELRDDALLDRVCGLSLGVTAISTATSFRMSATEAYAQLVEDRLQELSVRRVSGYSSLDDFTQRRFLPAIRTCAAHRRREQELAERASQYTALLRTRVETRIENQNGQLLRSLERSAVLQLRLQQLVEGLSVVALSYYALGLIHYVLSGFEHGGPGDIALSLLTPFAVMGTWFAVRRTKKRLLAQHNEPN